MLQHVNDSFEEDGIELTAEQAAKEIEDELVKRAEKFASVSKIKQKFEAPAQKLGPPKTRTKNNYTKHDGYFSEASVKTVSPHERVRTNRRSNEKSECGTNSPIRKVK